MAGGGVFRGGGVVFGEVVDKDKAAVAATTDEVVALLERAGGGVSMPSGERWRSCPGLHGEVCARIVCMLGRSMLICRTVCPQRTH